MGVQNAEAPCGEDEHRGHREQDLHQRHREFSGRAVEPRGDEVCDHGCEDDAEAGGNGRQQRQERHDSSGQAFGALNLAASDHAGVNRNERCGERAFAQQIPNDVGDAQRSPEGVGGGTVPEVVREHPLPDEAQYAGDEDPGGDPGR